MSVLFLDLERRIDVALAREMERRLDDALARMERLSAHLKSEHETGAPVLRLVGSTDAPDERSLDGNQDEGP